MAAEREIESESPRERSKEAIVAGPMSISVVGADVRLNRGRARCPLAGYRRLLKPFKSASPSASGSHPHRELAGGGDGDLKPVVDRRASSASLLLYPVVDSSIARRQPWPLSIPLLAGVLGFTLFFCFLFFVFLLVLAHEPHVGHC